MTHRGGYQVSSWDRGRVGGGTGTALERKDVGMKSRAEITREREENRAWITSLKYGCS